MKTVSFVIPLFNEEESVELLLKKLDSISSGHFEIVEYVVVDDGSTDGSFKKLKQFVGKTKRPLKVIRFRKNLGKSAALTVGGRKATGDFVVTLDADLQDEPKEIPKLLGALEKGSDLVIGWRKDRQDPLKKTYFVKDI